MVLHFIKNRGDIGQTAVDVLLRTVLWNVVVGTLLGIAIGTVMRYALIFVRRQAMFTFGFWTSGVAEPNTVGASVLTSADMPCLRLFPHRRKLMDEEAMLVFTLMMVFIMVGIANMLTTNELLACGSGSASILYARLL